MNLTMKQLFIELLNRFDEPGDIEAFYGPGIAERLWDIFEILMMGGKPRLGPEDQDLYDILRSLPSRNRFLVLLDIDPAIEVFEGSEEDVAAL